MQGARLVGASQEVWGKPTRGLGLSVTALAPAQWLGITFSSQARALRAGKVNTKIKTSEGCAFSGSDMQSNPMPQSLGRKDKRQALPWLAVYRAGRGRGFEVGARGAWSLGDHCSQGTGRGQCGLEPSEMHGKKGRGGWSLALGVGESSWSVLS